MGYPLVLKPDVGVGAADTFKVKSDADVEEAFSKPLQGYVAQKFVKGTIVTYDGMVDRDGKLVCRSATSTAPASWSRCSNSATSPSGA